MLCMESYNLVGEWLGSGADEGRDKLR